MRNVSQNQLNIHTSNFSIDCSLHWFHFQQFSNGILYVPNFQSFVFRPAFRKCYSCAPTMVAFPRAQESKPDGVRNRMVATGGPSCVAVPGKRNYNVSILRLKISFLRKSLCSLKPLTAVTKSPEIHCRLECVLNLLTYGRRNIIHTPWWPVGQAANRNANYLCDQAESLGSSASMVLSTMNEMKLLLYGVWQRWNFNFYAPRGHTIHSIHYGRHRLFPYKKLNI